MRALVLVAINLQTKFELSSFTRSKYMMGLILKNGLRDPYHAHLSLFVVPRLRLDIAYLSIL